MSAVVSKPMAPFTRGEEERVRDYWLDKKIREKVRKKQATGKEKFYFMDGPPYATGHIHMGTALNKIMKDCAVRSQRMQGKKIFDRPGFDTHGLPIENKVEKKLGFKTKKDIEDFGVEKFISECRNFATEFVETMGKEFDNLGDWMPYGDPYLTLSNEYIESIWFAFKRANEKDLLYLGKYPVHVCPHCATAVAYNEIVYSKLSDTAVYVKLKILDTSLAAKNLPKNSFLVVWTTTPWTLPANTGVMVHPKFEYVFAKLANGEVWVVAREKLSELTEALGATFTVEKTITGKELEGITYEPPFETEMSAEEKKKAFRVITSDRYVTLDTGSGLVHTAPGHGKEDFDAGMRAGLPAVSPVALDGTFTKEAKQFAGKQARETNFEIVADLESRGLLPLKHSYFHDYPLCWRCDSPLLMISVPQWFIRVSAIREEMLASNAKVQWVPVWMRDRMRNWLENLSDWPVSRARYWGAPLPIWVCECGEKKVIGSIRELKREAGLKKDVELHKPFIDEVTIVCKCGKIMRRVPEVLDVWFDSGVSSWANLGYPSSDKLFKEFWPADLNIEMTEQVRGWWNSQAILSTICFDKLPYKAVSVHGMVLDVGKKKMSKSRGAVSPEEVIAEYNRDYLRTYLLLQSKGSDFSFDAKGVGDVGSFFNTLTNSLNYALLYLEIDLEKKPSSLKNAEDAWILSRTESLSREVLSAYNAFEFSRAVVALQEFVDKDFSRTYLQLIRQRIGSDSKKELEATLSFVVNSLLRLLAPIAPHAAEYYFRHFNGEKLSPSIHLLDFADASKFYNEAIEKEFVFANAVAQAALALRTEQKLRTRWVLEELVVDSQEPLDAMSEALAKMVNVKKVVLKKGFSPSSDYALKEFAKGKVFLKVTASPQLKEVWELSELTRTIQDARKKAGLVPGQKIVLEIECSDKDFLKNNALKIEEKTFSKLKIVVGKKLEKLVEKSFWFEIKK